MRRTLLLLSLLTLLASTAHADVCNLSISVTCDSTSCTSVTRNDGTNICNGDFFVGYFAGVPPTQLSFTNFTNTLGVGDFCFDTSDPLFADETEAFVFCFGTAALAPGQTFSTHTNVHTNGAPASVPIIALTGVIDPLTDEELAFVYALNDISLPTCTPTATVASIAQSGVQYDVVWTSVSNAQASFQIDESTTSDFSSNVTTQTVSGLSAHYQHTVSANTTYYYRVRATACGGQQPGPNSRTVSIVVQAPPPPATAGNNTRVLDNVLPFGSETPFSFSLFIPPPAGKGLTGNATTTFNAATDKPYLTVSPSSGTVGPNGTTVTVTASPSGLPPGANTGTVSVTGENGASLANVPVSVSLVTPVSSSSKSLPPGNTLIIPVVTHVNGAGGPFQSDVRLTNASPSIIKYQVTFAPSNTDATQTAKSTLMSVDPNQTIALNDIVKDFFGIGATGATGDAGAGSLEIRPLNTSSTLTYASSRTFVTTALGTLGQFLPAVPFTKFATNAVNLPVPGTGGGGIPVLSMQQVAQSAKFRTNLGLVEGSGTPANGTIKIYDDLGTIVKTLPYSLKPGEHQQFSPLAGLTLDDGRIEITVESETGAVSAYASVLDNLTQDPLAVSPVQASQISSSRYVLPGMADVQGAVNSNFHSDIRIFNGGLTSVSVTPTFYPRNNGTPVQLPAITIGAGQVKAYDDVLSKLFNVTGTAGSIVLTTPSNSSVVATGRTYSVAGNGGTFGQFIPAVTPAEGIGLGDKPLQLLQLEQSQNFRTNLGLAELTGNPVKVRISATLPESKIASVIEADLAGNEFQQLGVVLSTFNPNKNSYNARLTIQVIGGTGRVTAYGSVLDNVTQDPTYVPAQ